MANKRLGNTYYIDTAYSTAEEYASLGIQVSQIILTSTGANARLVLSDGSNGLKVEIRLATAGETRTIFFYDHPMTFANSIRPTVVSNCVATIVFTDGKG